MAEEPVEEAPGSGPSRGAAEETRARLLAVLERMEKLDEAVERLENRTNTLVRLLDLMTRRVDRLEAQR